MGVLGIQRRLRVTSAICDEGATSKIKMAQLAIREPFTSHPCVGGWGRGGTQMGLLYAAGAPLSRRSQSRGKNTVHAKDFGFSLFFIHS